MNDKAIDKGADRVFESKWFFSNNKEHARILMRAILRDILSDPNYIEIDPDAELPKRIDGRDGGVQWKAGFDFAMCLVREDGWKKEKK